NMLPAAVGEALGRFADARLTVVAPAGHHVRLRDALAPAIHRRVTFVSWVDQARLMELYDSHRVPINPSFYEGGWKAHYEGMSRGLCMVCSAVGAMNDSIVDGVNGLLAKPGDARGLATQLTRALADSGAAAGMAAAARETACRYTWRRTAEEIVDFA